MKKSVVQLLLILIILSNISHAAVKNEGEYSPAISPDGARIAYHSNTSDHFFDVIIEDLATGATQNITQNSGYDTDPSWSPDGSQLVFSSSRQGAWDIYLYDLKTQKTTPLITSKSMDNQARWSPDGQSIAFLSRRDGLSQIYLYDMASNKVSRLTHTKQAAFHPSWSENGESIIFDQRVGEKSIIYQLDIRSGKHQQLYESDRSSIAGKLIDGKLYVTAKGQSSWDIVKYDIHSKLISDVAVSSLDEMKADLSPLHNLMVYSVKQADGVFRVVIKDLN